MIVTFSEPLAASSATNQANYALNRGVAITAATLGADLQTVLLATSALTRGETYTLTVNRVSDQAATPNLIRPTRSRSSRSWNSRRWTSARRRWPVRRCRCRAG